jgi:hypothetical protein
MRWALLTTLLNAVNFQCILGSIQSFLAKLGLLHHGRAASLWVFFAACGLTELLISFLVCTPLERFWPLTSWPKRNSIAADVSYAVFVRVVLFPLIAYFEYDWLRQSLDAFLGSHSISAAFAFRPDPHACGMARSHLPHQLRHP